MQSEAAMTELSPADTQALIAYARQNFAEERFPLAPGLRPIPRGSAAGTNTGC